ncbi:MmgE/PrpD family protein [Verminephrobacter eiseniae]|nr:MmgE/PrpD family protein [Verminephrobacter sp. Larva24]MCW5234773.1 MmgE/PrpD family protein [Verminephrobacter eiseniae]MCW5294074.1 MmgE/PrpD family protein [Verminephrobacter eiseniae]MCW8183188.1 MmgE/PrpD family protein [Verminephrobacter eiseniae]MCW8222129.1 MmgE/PrpD family protein [Verminephrobacter eiseniae]
MMPLRAGPFNTHCDQRTKAGSIPATNAVKTRNQAGDGQVAATRLLARWISGTGAAAISPGAFEWARHVMLDWLAVGIAGASEPLVRMLAEEYGGSADLPCTLLASGGARARPHDAALINGAAGHALDFDDVSSNMIGHPSAPVVPAALASAQIGNACGRQLLRALVVGHEVEARIGEMLGPSHYLHGFHATGTVGTFGAAAACASLRRLSEDQTAHALGLAATQAAGLKSMFGTMAKPLHAGKAAMNGLMATQLALRGFSANDCGIECPQGFALTMAPERHPFVAPIDTAAGFAIESTLFKYHAACYLTHSTIEAIRQLRQQHAVGLDALEGMTITVAGNQRGVCDIEDPKTGLGVKFSIKHLAALALDGADTADLGLYADATALDARYIEARQRIALVIRATGDGNAAQVSMRTRQGQSFTQTANVAIPATDLCAQWTRLLAKARSIAEPVIGPERFGRLVEAIVALDRAPTLQPLLDAIR